MGFPSKFKQSHIQQKRVIDSVSANELLDALRTLQNINIVQDQIDEDMNISFSQKDTFNNQYQSYENDNQEQQHEYNKNLGSNSSHKQNVFYKQKQNEKKNQTKMNFQFYMNKKQSKTLGNQKNRSRSPRPLSTVRPNISFKKSLREQNKQNDKQNNENVRKLEYLQKTPAKNDKSCRNGSLTQRKINNEDNKKGIAKENQKNDLIMNRKLRLRTQANEKDEYEKFQKLDNANISIKHQKNFIKNNKENLKLINNQNNKTVFTSNKPQQIIKSSFVKNFKKLSSLNQHQVTSTAVTIHQRTKQFLHKRNEKIAKLCHQLQQKKREQQKQCTFKPKIVSNTTNFINIKPKYNDLCSTKQLKDKHVRKFLNKISQNSEVLHEQQARSSINFNYNMSSVTGILSNKSSDPSLQFININNEAEQSIQDYNEHENWDQKLKDKSIDQECVKKNRIQKTRPQIIPKPKYKNQKFNILLDMIH